MYPNHPCTRTTCFSSIHRQAPINSPQLHLTARSASVPHLKWSRQDLSSKITTNPKCLGCVRRLMRPRIRREAPSSAVLVLAAVLSDVHLLRPAWSRTRSRLTHRCRLKSKRSNVRFGITINTASSLNVGMKRRRMLWRGSSIQGREMCMPSRRMISCRMTRCGDIIWFEWIIRRDRLGNRVVG